MKIEAIDLFCGVGGLTYGLQKSKIKVIAGLDNDESCRYSYEKNNNSNFILADIAEYDFKKIKRKYAKGSIKLLVGCAPCQPFSSHSFKYKDREDHHRKKNLLSYFSEAVEKIKPHIVSMENVRGLIKTDIFKEFLKTFKRLKYEVDYKIVYCPDYGIAQNRYRLVLLASKLGKIEIPQKTHTKNDYVTVKDVIKRLPVIKAGETSKSDSLHKSKHLTSINIKRIKQSKPCGTWLDWDKELLPNCYKKKSGQSYTSVYGRMSWNKVCPTITTQFSNYGSGRYGHPEQDRALSLREGAMIQTFPKCYDFGNEISYEKTGRHIGNAVPPRLGYVIGKTIINHLRSVYDK